MYFSALGPAVLFALGTAAATISQTEFDNLKNMAAVGYSYSMSPQGQFGAPPCTLPAIRDLSGTIWNYIDAYNMTDGAGGPITVRLFRRDDLGNQNYYIFFPGTSDARNWATNVQIDLVNYPLCSSCTVHKGFYQAWVGGRQGVIDMVKKAKDNRPATANYNIVVGGGSLGGALATLAYADLKSNKTSGLNPTRGISFGQPRLGNPVFAQFVNSLSGASPSNFGAWQRVTHGWDSIPRALPPPFYQHPGTEINMVDNIFAGNRPTASTSNIWFNVSPGNSESPFGNNSPSPAGPLGNLVDHLTYPGYGSESAACRPP